MSQAPLCAVKTTVLGAATLAIVAHLTDALHAGVWLQIPQPGYLLARGLTLAAGAAVLLVGWISNARRCERLPIRRLVERGARLTAWERSVSWSWMLMGLHSGVSLLR